MNRTSSVSAGIASIAVLGVILVGCSSDDKGDEAATTTATTSSTPATSTPAAASPEVSSPEVSTPAESTPVPTDTTGIPAEVPGTYSNGDWVVRLFADGTWEEDLNGQSNAYGGTYTVSGDQIVLLDTGGTSETATFAGDELALPSITLTRA